LTFVHDKAYVGTATVDTEANVSFILQKFSRMISFYVSVLQEDDWNCQQQLSDWND